MEFISETLQALDELDPPVEESEMRARLQQTADDARAIAPGLVGISITTRTGDLTFTLVATDAEIAALDAVQYLRTGPCVEAIEHGKGTATSDGGLMSEQRWQDLAHAGAATGVHSTLTFPILREGRTVASANLYGRTDGAFHGQHEALALAVGGWAGGVVTNADLSFSTRESARQAPRALQRDNLVAIAVGAWAERTGVSIAEAHDLIEDAAARAGIPVHELAQLLLDGFAGT